MNHAELAFHDLTELAAALRARQVSSLDVTRAMFERIAALDGRLHAYVSLMQDSAEAEARAADAAFARGEDRGPLQGVPVAVKDLCDAAGVVTTAGMPVVRANVAAATRDATVVARLRAAGAVILGKLQLTEGAVAHHHPAVTVPVNPHNPDYWSGASSSGSGVAVAAGLCYAALGSDTGGSIRFPSFANGITGLKPTWGRVSRAGVFPLSWSLDHVGPMARSSADCAAVLGAIAGADDADPTALDVAVDDYLGGIVTGIRGLRVGFDEAWATDNVDPAIAAALHAVLDAMRVAGARVVPVRMPSTIEVIAAWAPLCTADAAAAHTATYPAQAAGYGPGLGTLLDAGRAASAVDYALAHDVRLNFRGALAAVFDAVDVVIAPAYMRQNPTLAAFATFGEAEQDWPELIRFTAPFDISGTPTLSLPTGCNGDGAPLGIQLLGPHLGEATLLRAGHALQTVTDWHRRRPALG
ncbi:MAG: amidase [Gammaproteobacteria bacterium]